ncbi:MAG: helix-turn-helix domain-containing protein [Panacagrimonas sp.]
MTDPYLLKLGQRLRACRENLGLTQEALADLASLDRSYVGGVERGERNVTFLVLCRLCAAMKLDLGELAAGMPGPSK